MQVGANYRFHLGPKLIFESLKIRKLGRLFGQTFTAVCFFLSGTQRKIILICIAQKKLGGGVLLDIIHEIDLVNWFFGKCNKIIGRALNSGTLKIETEEIADIIFFV